MFRGDFSKTSRLTSNRKQRPVTTGRERPGLSTAMKIVHNPEAGATGTGGGEYTTHSNSQASTRWQMFQKLVQDNQIDPKSVQGVDKGFSNSNYFKQRRPQSSAFSSIPTKTSGREHAATSKLMPKFQAEVILNRTAVNASRQRAGYPFPRAQSNSRNFHGTLTTHNAANTSRINITPGQSWRREVDKHTPGKMISRNFPAHSALNTQLSKPGKTKAVQYKILTKPEPLTKTAQQTQSKEPLITMSPLIGADDSKDQISRVSRGSILKGKSRNMKDNENLSLSSDLQHLGMSNQKSIENEEGRTSAFPGSSLTPSYLGKAVGEADSQVALKIQQNQFAPNVRFEDYGAGSAAIQEIVSKENDGQQRAVTLGNVYGANPRPGEQERLQQELDSQILEFNRKRMSAGEKPELMRKSQARQSQIKMIEQLEQKRRSQISNHSSVMDDRRSSKRLSVQAAKTTPVKKKPVRQQSKAKSRAQSRVHHPQSKRAIAELSHLEAQSIRLKISLMKQFSTEESTERALAKVTAEPVEPQSKETSASPLKHAQTAGSKTLNIKVSTSGTNQATSRPITTRREHKDGSRISEGRLISSSKQTKYSLVGKSNLGSHQTSSIQLTSRYQKNKNFFQQGNTSRKNKGRLVISKMANQDYISIFNQNQSNLPSFRPQQLENEQALKSIKGLITNTSKKRKEAANQYARLVGMKPNKKQEKDMLVTKTEFGSEIDMASLKLEKEKDLLTRFQDDRTEREKQLSESTQVHLTYFTKNSNNQVQNILTHLEMIQNQFEDQKMNEGSSPTTKRSKQSSPLRGQQLKKVDVTEVIRQTSQDIKMLNYELKRVVATDEDSFTRLVPSQVNSLEVMQNIPMFAKMAIPDLSDMLMEGDEEYRFEMPLCIQLLNTSATPADIEVFMSMDTRDPGSMNCEKKFMKRVFMPGTSLRFTYGEAGTYSLKDKKFPDTLFFHFSSLKGLTMKLSSHFTKKILKRGHKDNMSNDKLQRGMTLASQNGSPKRSLKKLADYDDIQQIVDDLDMYMKTQTNQDAKQIDFVERNKSEIKPTLWKQRPKSSNPIAGGSASTPGATIIPQKKPEMNLMIDPQARQHILDNFRKQVKTQLEKTHQPSRLMALDKTCPSIEVEQDGQNPGLISSQASSNRESMKSKALIRGTKPYDKQLAKSRLTSSGENILRSHGMLENDQMVFRLQNSVLNDSQKSLGAASLLKQLEEFGQPVVEKADLARVKREEMDKMQRTKNSKYLSKWDKYRDTKLALVKNYIRLLKNIKRVKVWISLIQAHTNVVRVCKNSQMRLEEMQRKFSEFLIGIGFKVRFYMRYSRQQGGDVYFREKNRMRYKISFLGNVEYLVKEEKAKGIMLRVLQRTQQKSEFKEKIYEFRKKIDLLDTGLKFHIDLHQSRLEQLKEQTIDEFNRLIQIYTQKAKERNKRKTAARFLSFIKEMDINSEEVDKMVRDYQLKLRTDHLLEFSLAKYVQQVRDISKAKRDLEYGYGNDEELKKIIGDKEVLKVKFLSRIKHYRILSGKLNEELFSNTLLIDEDQTFDIVVRSEVLTPQSGEIKNIPKPSMAQVSTQKQGGSKRQLKTGKKGGSKKANKQEADNMSPHRKLELFQQDRADRKQQQIDEMITEILKGKDELQIEELPRLERFIFLPRKVHLHKIICKASGFQYQQQ